MKSRRVLHEELEAILGLLSTHRWTAEERILIVLTTYACLDGRADHTVSCEELTALSGFDHDTVEAVLHKISREVAS